jgi:hypothetical protein
MCRAWAGCGKFTILIGRTDLPALSIFGVLLKGSEMAQIQELAKGRVVLKERVAM